MLALGWLKITLVNGNVMLLKSCKGISQRKLYKDKNCLLYYKMITFGYNSKASNLSEARMSALFLIRDDVGQF